VSDAPGQRSLRPVPFARRLIEHQKKRTAVAAAGIGFAILVIFMQLAFYGTVVNTALAISGRLDAEVVLVSPRFINLADTGVIDKGRLFQVLAVPGVESASPLYFRYAGLRDPLTENGCRVFMLGVPVGEGKPNLLVEGLAEQLPKLRVNDTLLLDDLTQSKCGPTSPDGASQIFQHSTTVVGHYALGVGFLADGSVIVSDDTFSRVYQGGHNLDKVHLGLVKLVDEADPAAVARQVEATLPGDVRVMTLDELNAVQTRYWVENTAVGNIFGLGTLAGFLVGMVVLYQILSTDIRNHLPLYATLRAMGYSNRRLYGYVIEQSWIFAILGFGPALIVSSILFPIVHGITKMPIYMTLGLAVFVLLLSVVMCSLAAIFSARRLRAADPAELF